MADPQLPIPDRNSKTGSIIALVLAASAAIAPFTMSKEGTIYKAYQDPVGIWTICDGHTKGVRAGQTATKVQCLALFQEDMKGAMLEDIKYSPSLAENKQALEAVGDLTFNGGPGAYLNSPIKEHLDKKEWIQGCDAFVGWWDTASSPRPIRNAQCTYSYSRHKYSCKLPGLVSRRIGEKNICLGIAQPSPVL